MPMILPSQQAVWASGAAYEAYVGRWSRLVAQRFLVWLAIPAGERWLDVGCGTGAISQTILAMTEPAGVVGLDPSPGFVRHARDRLAGKRIRLVNGDAQALPFGRAAFDVAVCGLVLNFVPEPALAVTEMARAVRPGGVVAAYVWDYAEGMHCMRAFWDAAAALDPAARERDEGRRFSLCQPDRLAALFQAAGLTATDGRAIDVPTHFASFDDYWSPFLGGQGAAPGYVATLAEAPRLALRERLRASLPTDPDGAIRLTARAWAVRGTAG